MFISLATAKSTSFYIRSLLCSYVCTSMVGDNSAQTYHWHSYHKHGNYQQSPDRHKFVWHHTNTQATWKQWRNTIQPSC